MKVAAIQHDIVWEDRAANLRALRVRIADAAADGARLVLLAEMFATGFSMDTDAIAEPADGPTAVFLRETAVELDCWIGGSISCRERGDERARNVLVLAGPDGQLHRYAKLHPFTYAREHEHYAPGDQRVTVDVDGLRVSLFVCYDLRFADEFWALAAETDCYVVVANWPAARRRHWSALLRARAIENQAYVVGVNRVGDGNGLAYAGDSVILDPLGEPLAEAPNEPPIEMTLSAEVDPAVVGEVRARFPFLQDRR